MLKFARRATCKFLTKLQQQQQLVHTQIRAFPPHVDAKQAVSRQEFAASMQSVAALLQKQGKIIQKGDTIGVCVSGGADSMALAFLAKDYARDHGIKVYICNDFFILLGQGLFVTTNFIFLLGHNCGSQGAHGEHRRE